MITTIIADQLFDGKEIQSNRPISFEHGRIISFDLMENAKVIQVAGLLTPGFIDTQVNGGGGVLFNHDTSLATLKTMVRAHSRYGTTGLLPTLITSDLNTIGKTAFLTDIVAKAGGTSVTNDVPMGFPKISKENAVELNPDAIILSDSPDNNEPNDAFDNSNAVKNSKVYKINADILSRPAPRIVDALEQIAAKLHPDKFE